MARIILELLLVMAIPLLLVYLVGRQMGRAKAMADIAKTYGDRIITGDPAARDAEFAVWGEDQANADGSSRQDIIARLNEGDGVELLRGRDALEGVRNVAVVSEKGEIGRLAQGDAARVAPYLDRGGRVMARISAIRGGTKDKPDYDVWIVVRPLDDS